MNLKANSRIWIYPYMVNVDMYVVTGDGVEDEDGQQNIAEYSAIRHILALF